MENNLSIIHWNCNSVRNKQIEFIDFLKKFKPCIVSLSETKLSASRFESEPLLAGLENYFMIHKHRSQTINGAGGVALLIRKDIQFSTFNLDDLSLELLGIEIKINNQDLIIISYYNPPDKNLSKSLFEKIR